jgi:hypothetical protein
LKASYSSLEDEISSKRLELEQLEDSINEIKSTSKKLKEEGKNKAVSKNKVTKSEKLKKGKKSLDAKKSNALIDVDEAGDNQRTVVSNVLSLFQFGRVQDYVINMAFLGLQHRAIPMFVLASAGIYLFGEYALA